MPAYILTITCPDGPGIIHAVSGSLLEVEANVLEQEQYSDLETGLFFARTKFETTVDDIDRVRAVIIDRTSSFGTEVGLRLEPMSAPAVQKLQARYRGGLVVVEVREDGPAAEQGIRAGDILVGLHVWETIAIDNIAYILDRAEEDHLNPIKFYVLRGRETLFGHLVSDTIRR